jgi:TfoX/Sxy family transcriptional regulator of competence genes
MSFRVPLLFDGARNLILLFRFTKEISLQIILESSVCFEQLFTGISMSYDLNLADRIRTILNRNGVRYKDKEMFGGVAFMVKEKMCVGIVKNELMARIDPEIFENALKKKGARPMDFAGRPIKGYVFVSPPGIDSAKDLIYWVNLCLEFNPKAKSSKKKITSRAFFKNYVYKT